MKTIYKILILIFVATLWACEKNDPLADQGRLTGGMVPFNLLAQMPDAAAGDTLVLRNVSWAIHDNIEKIDFFHSGFKVRNYEVKMAVPLSGGKSYEKTISLLEDSIIFQSAQVKSFPETGNNLNEFYQTQENAYVILYRFVIPEQYALSRDKNDAVVTKMTDKVFESLVTQFRPGLNREMLLAFFPNLNPYSVIYFKFDTDGFFTGELTQAGFNYFTDNITREIMNKFLKEATVSDNTRVRIRTEASIKGSNLIAPSTRMFRVL
jgi:hypothetical protein